MGWSDGQRFNIFFQYSITPLLHGRVFQNPLACFHYLNMVYRSVFNSRYQLQVFLRTSIRVLPVTLRLLSSMAETATRGFRRPSMATGILMPL